MHIIKNSFTALVIIFAFALNNAKAQSPADSTITVPLGGNGWVNKSAQAKITDSGLTNWSSADDTVNIYLRPELAGTLQVALKLRVPAGVSKISISVGNTTLSKTISDHDANIISFGQIDINKPGYIKLQLKGISKTGAIYADISDLLLSGTALAKRAAYVKDNHGDYFYWGHRGPSVHLNYKLPDAVKNNAEWFYNEVTVPVGQDVVGSYFMADGFTGGYFGMQVNSATERHILFSIWSPYTTNDPKSIPDSLKIKLLKKGTGVHAGEFGNEGSGGQSYLTYPWKAGKTYAFLLHAQADSASKTTVFTAYFKEKGQAEWQLVASFKRPQSGFYLKGLYSFLENFDPEMGTVTRKVFFGNEWICSTANKWYPINEALFTGDATANINYRKDYSGGTEKDFFYLRNCGFFDDFTKLRSNLIRYSSGKDHPQINFEKLP
jgi:hypothetical protein